MRINKYILLLAFTFVFHPTLSSSSIASENIDGYIKTLVQKQIDDGFCMFPYIPHTDSASWSGDVHRDTPYFNNSIIIFKELSKKFENDFSAQNRLSRHLYDLDSSLCDSEAKYESAGFTFNGQTECADHVDEGAGIVSYISCALTTNNKDMMESELEKIKKEYSDSAEEISEYKSIVLDGAKLEGRQNGYAMAAAPFILFGPLVTEACRTHFYYETFSSFYIPAMFASLVKAQTELKEDPNYKDFYLKPCVTNSSNFEAVKSLAMLDLESPSTPSDVKEKFRRDFYSSSMSGVTSPYATWKWNDDDAYSWHVYPDPHWADGLCMYEATEYQALKGQDLGKAQEDFGIFDKIENFEDETFTKTKVYHPNQGQLYSKNVTVDDRFENKTYVESEWSENPSAGCPTGRWSQKNEDKICLIKKMICLTDLSDTIELGNSQIRPTSSWWYDIVINGDTTECTYNTDIPGKATSALTAATSAAQPVKTKIVVSNKVTKDAAIEVDEMDKQAVKITNFDWDGNNLSKYLVKSAKTTPIEIKGNIIKNFYRIADVSGPVKIISNTIELPASAFNVITGGEHTRINFSSNTLTLRASDVGKIGAPLIFGEYGTSVNLSGNSFKDFNSSIIEIKGGVVGKIENNDFSKSTGPVVTGYYSVGPITNNHFSGKSPIISGDIFNCYVGAIRGNTFDQMPEKIVQAYSYCQFNPRMSLVKSEEMKNGQMKLTFDSIFKGEEIPNSMDIDLYTGEQRVVSSVIKAEMAIIHGKSRIEAIFPEDVAEKILSTDQTTIIVNTDNRLLEIIRFTPLAIEAKKNASLDSDEIWAFEQGLEKAFNDAISNCSSECYCCADKNKCELKCVDKALTGYYCRSPYAADYGIECNRPDLEGPVCLEKIGASGNQNPLLGGIKSFACSSGNWLGGLFGKNRITNPISPKDIGKQLGKQGIVPLRIPIQPTGCRANDPTCSMR